MNLYKLELRKQKKGFIIWTIALVCIILLYLGFFPSIKEAGFSDMMSEKMKLLPEALLKSFNLDVMPNFSDFMQYFAYVYQFIIMAVYVYALVLGTSIISREENEKTIEYLYANPISRKEIITSKLLSSVTMIFGLMASIFIISFIMGVTFADINIVGSLAKIIGISLIPTYAYLSIGLVLSVVLKRVNQGTMIALGIFFGTYIIGIMSGVIEQLEFLKYISPYNYAVPMTILRGEFDLIGISLGILLILVSIFTTYFVYQRKDLN